MYVYIISAGEHQVPGRAAHDGQRGGAGLPRPRVGGEVSRGIYYIVLYYYIYIYVYIYSVAGLPRPRMYV